MKKEENKIHVAIYTRVSTIYQIDKDSLPYQKETLENYAIHILHADSYEVFTDAGFSGTSIRRPGYLRMMDKIRKDKFTHLLVWKIDRISRNLIDFIEMYQELQKRHVTFVSRTEQFDTSSAIGNAMLRIILTFAQLESEMTGERIHAVLNSKASTGNWNGGQPPYGYRYNSETKEIAVNETEAQVVKYIFRSYEILRSCRAVANRLNTNHLKTTARNAWSAQAVEDILKNPFYIGILSYNKRAKKQESETGHSSMISLEEHHRPLIEAKLFKLCNSILFLQSNQSKTRTRKQTHCHVLSGLLYCAKCGQPLLSQAGNIQKSGWKCSSYVCRARKKKHCDNPYTSDFHLLPPLFFYLLRILQVQAIFESIWSLDTFEKHLLAHPELQGQRPTKKSLHDLYRYMEKGVFNNLDLLPFQSIVYGDILDPETEGCKIESELSVLSNALIKLEKH